MTAPYASGTITLTNGSNIIVGNDTGWKTALVGGGTVYPEAANGNAMAIVIVDTDTKITAATKWMGATGTYPYAIMRDTSYGQQTVDNAQALAKLVQRLGVGILSDLSALTPDENKVVAFGESAEASLADLSPFGKSLIAVLNSSAAYGMLGEIPSEQLPARLRALPTFVNNWNNVRENGFYFGGPESANTPAQPWSFIGVVKAQSSSYCVQTLTALGVSDPASNVTFERQIVNNVPSAWFRVRYTEAELDARYMRPSQAVSNSQLPGRLRQDGQVITDWNNAIQSGFYFGESAANSPPGIDGGLIGYVAAASGDGAVVQTVVRWWGISPTASVTWRRAKQGPNSWTAWDLQITSVGELDARYNRLSVAIQNSQLPFTQTGKNFTSFTRITGGTYANGGAAFGIEPSDPGNGKPTLYFTQTPNAPQWNIDLYDGATTSGIINFGVGSLTHNGNQIRTAATAYAKSETYTQAEIQSLVTTARRVRLGALAEFGTTAFVWNDAAAGGFVTGMFLDGAWGVRNIRHRTVQQTDLSGNWVTVAQA